MGDSILTPLHEPDGKELQEIWKWNCKVPPTVDRCIHDLFAEQAEAQPLALAICAWDGKLTYRELDELSTKLAGHLVELGVRPEDIVPLCFEKSMWTVVAMLAVLKVGGAFAPLDPEHPVIRHEAIFQQTGARVVLASVQHSKLWRYSGRTVFPVSGPSVNLLVTNTSEIPSTPDPSNAAYVIFTSGSTGVPKGVVVEHRAVSTSCLGHGRAFGLTPHARVLQFASYTFDACITEIITTLVYGGCVCVPSERDRQDGLAKFIQSTNVNWALLTPTVARMLDPNMVPLLMFLVFGGEEVNSDDWDRWEGHVHRTNTYGPTECSVWCTSYAEVQGFKSGTIGTSIASVSWIVDPKNYDILAPLGSIGELLVEGPVLARGYLDNAEKTEDAFVNDPAWLIKGCGDHPGRRGRLYKTGDLVRYEPNGNLVYMGRKDTQVKVRGQRVELGEIEHYVREYMPETKHVTVEVITLDGEKDKAIVAAFLEVKEEMLDKMLDGSPADKDLLVQVISLSEITERLTKILPRYMVPAVFFALSRIPITTSGKTDRKRLREISASFSSQQLAEMRTSSEGPKRAPSTDAERAFQQL
jgi:amino acid adenylation domain-containing protein